MPRFTATAAVWGFTMCVVMAQTRGPFINPEPLNRFTIALGPIIVSELAISPNDQIVFTASKSQAYAFDWSTGSQLGTLPITDGLLLPPAVLTHQPPNGPALLYLAAGQYVRAYTANSSMFPVWTYNAFVLTTGALYANGSTLAVATSDGHITSLDAATGLPNWIFSANYYFQQPPGPVVGYGGVYFANNNFIVALDKTAGTFLWNASVAGQPLDTAPVLNEAMNGLVCGAFGALTTTSTSFTVNCYFASSGALAWSQTIPVINDSSDDSADYVMRLYSSGPSLMVRYGPTFALNASFGGLVYWISSNISSTAAPSSDQRWILSAGALGNDTSLDGHEIGSGYFDFSVAVPYTQAGCLGTAFATQRRAVQADGIVAYAMLSCGVLASQALLFTAFNLPVPRRLTVKECADNKCNVGCQNVDYLQRCTADKWWEPATVDGSKTWSYRTCGRNDTNLNVWQVAGASCIHNLVSRTTQFMNQCVINENGYHSSQLLKCYHN